MGSGEAPPLYRTRRLFFDRGAIAVPPTADDVCMPIGRAIRGIRLVVVDRWLAPVPVGVVGIQVELFQKGPQGRQISGGLLAAEGVAEGRLIDVRCRRGPLVDEAGLVAIRRRSTRPLVKATFPIVNPYGLKHFLGLRRDPHTPGGGRAVAGADPRVPRRAREGAEGIPRLR